MDIKITFDVTPKLADLAERVCNALERKALFIPARDDDPGYAMLDSLFPRSKASDLPVETPEPSPVSKPVEPLKSEPGAKIEAPAAAIDETPAPEVKDETPAPEVKAEKPAEPSKPKRSHHKKVESSKPEPEKPAEPAPAAVEPEPEPETDAAPEMTLDEIRSVCVKAAKAGKTKVITDYLAAHDAESLSKLDPKLYVELSKIVEAAL